MTATTNNASSTPHVPDLVHKVAEQLVSSLKQGQQLTVDAAQVWSKAAAALPVPDLPKVPGIPATPSVEAITAYVFDLAAKLLQTQREFALHLVNAIAPAKSA